MSVEKVKISALLPNGATEECSLDLILGEPSIILFSGLGQTAREYAARDLFEALKGIRLELESNGVRLLCAGARRDAYPSGMSRSMGGGRKAYICQMGKPGKLENLIDIFEPAESEQVVTVAEQEAYREAWIKSLG